MNSTSNSELMWMLSELFEDEGKLIYFYFWNMFFEKRDVTSSKTIFFWENRSDFNEINNDKTVSREAMDQRILE